MSSEAITQNDLREILSRTVGSIPSEYKKLLWINPNPTTAFNAQTISLDLSNYDAVEVVYKLYTTQQYDVTGQITYQSNQSVTVSASGTGGFFSGADAPMARTSSMSSNGVHFSAGSLCGGSSTWAVNNNVLIPYKIYGIKYERVAPPQTEDARSLQTYVGASGVTINYSHAYQLGNIVIFAITATLNGSFNMSTPLVGIEGNITRLLSPMLSYTYNNATYLYPLTSIISHENGRTYFGQSVSNATNTGTVITFFCVGEVGG